MSEEERAAIQAKIGQLSGNWQVYAMAEQARDWKDMNDLNKEHREIMDWLEAHGILFDDLVYDRETLTFSTPSAILAVAAHHATY